MPVSDQAYEKDAFVAVLFVQAQESQKSSGKAVWAVGNSLLRLIWPAYFDDFLSLCEGASVKHIDM